MYRDICSFVQSLVVKRPLKSLVAAVAFCAAVLSITTHSGSAAVGPDPAFEAKKAEIFKKFDVRVAKPGEFPITVFPTDKVPPVMHDRTYPGDIAWLDNDTIIYVEQTDLPPAKVRSEPDLLSLVAVNLKTLERRELLKVTRPQFCFDSETKNIEFAESPGKYGSGITTFKFGTLGKPLQTFTRSALEKGERPNGPYIHPLDCAFFPVIPPPGDIGRSLIRIADGYVGHDEEYGQIIPGSYLFRDLRGNFKTLKIGQSNNPDFHFDAFSNSYWHAEDTHGEKGQADGIKVWRLNRRFDVTSEEFYRHGPWAFGNPLTTSVRPGFIVNGVIYGGDKLTLQSQIHAPRYLASKDGIIREIAEDIGARFAVSPDGCKAITTQLEPQEHGYPRETGQLVQIDFCHKS